MSADEHPRIRVESSKRLKECLVCSSEAASECTDLARAFAAHFDKTGASPAGEALLNRVDRVHEWGVCEDCQERLTGEDKLRLMSIWMVLESLRNWIKTEVRVHPLPQLPCPPPIQLA